MDKDTNTLLGSELAWAPFVRAGLAATTLVGITLLTLSCGRCPSLLWGACVTAWLVPTVSNALYLRQHALPTVGMTPLAAASLTPAAVPAAYAGTNPLAWVCLVAGIVVKAVFGWWFLRLRHACVNAPAIPDDAVVIVLGGAIVGGKPGRTLTYRLDTVLEVFAAHPHTTFVLTGGPVPFTDSTEASVMRDYLVARGVPAHALLLEPQARNTAQNLRYSLQLLDRKGVVGTPCVLTSDYHLYRAVREGRRLGVALVPIAAPTPANSRAQQWCREVITIMYKG